MRGVEVRHDGAPEQIADLGRRPIGDHTDLVVLRAHHAIRRIDASHETRRAALRCRGEERDALDVLRLTGRGLNARDGIELAGDEADAHDAEQRSGAVLYGLLDAQHHAALALGDGMVQLGPVEIAPDRRAAQRLRRRDGERRVRRGVGTGALGAEGRRGELRVLAAIARLHGERTVAGAAGALRDDGPLGAPVHRELRPTFRREHGLALLVPHEGRAREGDLFEVRVVDHACVDGGLEVGLVVDGDGSGLDRALDGLEHALRATELADDTRLDTTGHALLLALRREEDRAVRRAREQHERRDDDDRDGDCRSGEELSEGDPPAHRRGEVTSSQEGIAAPDTSSPPASVAAAASAGAASLAVSAASAAGASVPSSAA